MEPVRGVRVGRWRHAACGLAILGAVLFLLAPAPVRGEPLEYQVKAVFLLNFTKFVEWPAGAFAGADSPIEICVLGEDKFGASLDQAVAGEAVNGRRVTVRRIMEAPAARGCQVLFLGAPEKERARILAGLETGILTVGEGESFTHEGGMIAFFIEKRHVRFAINQTAAEKAGLKLSARLLNVASSVER